MKKRIYGIITLALAVVVLWALIFGIGCLAQPPGESVIDMLFDSLIFAITVVVGLVFVGLFAYLFWLTVHFWIG